MQNLILVQDNLPIEQTNSLILEILEKKIISICQQIPPFWELNNMVAVNPFLGNLEGGLEQWNKFFQYNFNSSALPNWEIFRQAFQAQEFSKKDIEDISVEKKLNANSKDLLLKFILEKLSAPQNNHFNQTGSVANSHLDLEPIYKKCLIRFLAAYFDKGVARIQWPKKNGLFQSFRNWVEFDSSLENLGVKNFRKKFLILPEDPKKLRLYLFENFSGKNFSDFALKRLLEFSGWSGWIRRQAWETSHEDLGDLPDFLTLIWACHAICNPAWSNPKPSLGNETPLEKETSPFNNEVSAEENAETEMDALARSVILNAWENSTRHKLISSMQNDFVSQGKSPDNLEDKSPKPPEVQSVFCIDVRSESFRKKLEEQNEAYETYGFAGFFAMPFATEEGKDEVNQCPVLLKPMAKIKILSKQKSGWAMQWQSFRRSALGGFAFMEIVGPLKAAKLIQGSFPKIFNQNKFSNFRKSSIGEKFDLKSQVDHLDNETKVSLLKGMLKHLGLKPPYARLVVFCGHESQVENNAQQAGLACGACGGHSGEINAKLAAHFYNDPELRKMLTTNTIPTDSVAIAALHETCTDSLFLFPEISFPGSHIQDLEKFSKAAEVATLAVQKLRQEKLPGFPNTLPAVAPKISFSNQTLQNLFGTRSLDWSETRPEWGLADNAFFIVAPRLWTKNLNLERRAFLHSYDSALDPDGDTLELILIAPVVVASWINLQYYASTVLPNIFGSGDKTLHTVVAGIGVAEGLSGDIRYGLAQQSIMDGEQLRHRPQRLQVIIADKRERISAIINRHEQLQALVKNSWIKIVCMEGDAENAYDLLPNGEWKKTITEPV